MRKTKEILRLKFEGGLGNHKIGRALSVSASTGWDTVARFQATGPTVPIVDRRTGELRGAHVFVAVLGCSNYTYIEATWGEDLRSWHTGCG